MRDHFIDALKGMGILAVIAGHVPIPLLWINTYSFHMPLFFIVAGFFLNLEKDFGSFFKSKFKSLLIPFYKYIITFACIYWLLHLTNLPLFHGYVFETTFNMKMLFIDPFLHCHNFPLILPLWFVSSLFIAMVIVGLIRPLLKRCLLNDCSSKFSAVVIFIVLEILTYYALPVTDAPPQLKMIIPVIFRTLIICCFIILGCFIWKKKEIFMTQTLISIMSLVFLFLCWKYNYAYAMVWNGLGNSVIERLLFPVYGITGLYFSFMLTQQLCTIPHLKKALEYFGRKSFHIMALHLSGFALFNLLLTRSDSWSISNISSVGFRFPISLIFYFIFSLAFSVACCFIYDKFNK